jgi:HlyD family secretion protein
VKKRWLLLAIVAVCCISGGAYVALNDEEGNHARGADDARPQAASGERTGERRTNGERRANGDRRSGGSLRVQVVKPRQGGSEKTITVPGSVESFERARLFSKVSGYLVKQSIEVNGIEQKVDIGDRVKKGDVLAEISMPELEKEVERDVAAVKQAEANVEQMKARVKSAKADAEAAEALIGERLADVESSTSMEHYRKQVFDRISELVRKKGVEERLKDEMEEHYHAAKAALTSSKAAVVSAEAQAHAAEAKITEAEADLSDALAKVEVAKAVQAKNEVFLEYTKIKAPFDGVITARNFHVGDFINSRDQGATIPLLVVDETDKMRVVVQLPDLDVPYANPGDEATVEIASLPGQQFSGEVARMADSEDPHTRTMRTEVDLKNPKDKLHPSGILRDGFYGTVTILLEKASDNLTLPSSIVHVEAAKHGESGGHRAANAYVWVARDGKAEKVHVKIGSDNGVETEILSGLKADDDVIMGAKGGGLAEGVPVALASDR